MTKLVMCITSMSVPRNAEVDQGIPFPPFLLGGDPAKRCNANLQNALAMGWDALQLTGRRAGQTDRKRVDLVRSTPEKRYTECICT